MSLLDCVLAQACADIYADSPVGFERVHMVGDVVVGHRVIDGCSVLAFRGSKTAQDWLDDLAAVPVHVDRVGHVHAGFYDDLEATLGEVCAELREACYVTGHSLGAARAFIFAALLHREGWTPRAVTAFAPPRAGWADLRDTLCLSGALLRAYHNRHDPVPMVPVFPFVHPVAPTLIDVPPADGDLSPLRAHHMALYLKGVTA